MVLLVDLIRAGSLGPDRGILKSLLAEATTTNPPSGALEWPAIASAERETVINLLRSNNVVEAQSLLEIPPLVIAAIVGGVILAGVAAAAVAFLGVAGLTVGLLWAFGVFNSHKDRRRKNDSAGACESTNPLDTNDPDCFALRFSKISSYWSNHANLVRMNRAVVKGEGEMSSLWNNAFLATERNEDKIYGLGGTYQRPSSATGLFHEIGVDMDASKQLQAASVASLSSMYDSVDRLMDDSTSDVAELKMNLATGFSTLKDDAQGAVDLQRKYAQLNNQLMTGGATKALSDSVDEVLTLQRESGDQMHSVSRISKSAVQDVVFNKKLISNVLDDGEETVEKLDKSLESRKNTVSSQIESSTTVALKAVSKASEAAQQHAMVELELLTKDFNAVTSDQVRTSRAEWTNSTRESIGESRALADGADGEVLGPLITRQADLVGSGSAVVTEAIGGLQGDMMMKESKNQQSQKSVSSSASGLGSDTSNATSSAVNDAQEISWFIEDRISTVRNKVTSLLSSMGVSNDGMSSLMSTIDKAEKGAKSSLFNEEEQFLIDASEAMRGVGENGLTSSQSVKDLYDVLSASKSKSSKVIGNTVQSSLTASKLQGQTLMTSIDSVGDKTSAMSAVIGNAFLDLQNVLSNQLFGGSRDFSQSLSEVQSTNKYELNGVLGSILNNVQSGMRQADSSHDVGSLLMKSASQSDQQNSDLSAILNQVVLGDSSAVSQLSAALSGGDDMIGSTIDRELRNAQARMVQSGNAVSARLEIDRIVRSAIRDLSDKRNRYSSLTSDLRMSDTRAIDKSKQLSEQGNSLLNEALSRLNSISSSRSSINGKMGGKLTNLNISDYNSMANLRIDGTTGLNATVQSLISSVFKSITDSQQARLKEKSGMLSSDLTSLKNTGDKLSLNTFALGELATAQANDGATAHTDLKMILSKLIEKSSKKSDSNSLELRRISNQLESMKSTASEGLRNISSSVQSEILRIPLMVIAGSNEIDSDISLASSDLSNRIQQARLAAGSAKTDQDRQAALRGLDVLVRLQSIQQGVFQADRTVRSQLASQTNVSVISQTNVMAALGNMLSAISDMNTKLGAKADMMVGSSRSITTDAEVLWSEFDVLTNQTRDSMTSTGAQEILRQALGFSKQQSRLDRGKLETSYLSEMNTNRSMNYWTANFRDIEDISNLIARATKITTKASRNKSESIDRVFEDVTRKRVLMDRNLSAVDEDVLTRIALVRMAMSSFLALWNEFVAAIDSRQYRLAVNDREFLTGTETDIKRELIRGESYVNSTSRNLVGLRSVIQSVNLSEIAFESDFNSDLKAVIGELGSLNKRRNQQMTNTSNTLNEAVNTASRETGIQLDLIDSLMDEFSAII